MITSPDSPLSRLVHNLRKSKLVKFYEFANAHFGELHLKELSVSAVGPEREMRVGNHELVNFGFDSFLGLDHDPRVSEALVRGAQKWGTQFGASRAFASCEVEVELESKLPAGWAQKPP